MEVAVVGGGPVGMWVAKQIAEAGFETTVLEEDRKIGRPVRCAGLVSPRVVSKTDTDSTIMKASKAIIHPPQGDPLVLEAPEEKAYVIDRGRFDREMAEKASNAGAHIELDAKVLDTVFSSRRKLRYQQDGKEKQILSDLVIGADGPHSIMRKMTSMPGPKELLVGVQAIVAEDVKDISIFLGNDVSPDFFGYELPHTSGSLVGVGSSDGHAYEHLKRLIKRRGFENDILGYSAGTIPLGRMKESVRDGLMLVGDASCQVKPLSGGGLYPGLHSADICAEVAISALEDNDTSKERLQEYHDRWQSDIGSEISKGMWMRRIFKNMSDEDLSKILGSLKDEKVKRVVEIVGDIDYPSTLAKPVLKASPKLIKFAGPMIKNIF